MIRVPQIVRVQQLTARVATCILASLLLFSALRAFAQTTASTSLTAAAVTAADGSGIPCGYGGALPCLDYEYWTTWGNFRLYLQDSSGTWVNPGYGPPINIPLTPGDYNFGIFGTNYYSYPYYELALYFDNHGGGGSTFYLCNGAADMLVWSPEGASTLTTGIANGCLGTGSKVFSDANSTVTLTRFVWNAPSADLVSPTNNVPDGLPDFIGAFSLHVTQALAITTPSIQGVAAGVAYNATLEATGGTGPYTWCILDGSICDPNPASPAALPAGFTLNSSSGKITAMDGNAAVAATYDFTVQVTDSEGATATRMLTLVVSCQVNPGDVQPYASGDYSRDGKPTTEFANFVPTDTNLLPVGLQAKATACNFTKFNWQQAEVVLPTPQPISVCTSGIVLPNGKTLASILCTFANTNPTQPLIGSIPYDPVQGGYTYESYNDDAFPFYWTASELSPDFSRGYSMSNGGEKK